MITVGDLVKWYGKKYRVMFILGEDDVQSKAKELYGRELTDDELYSVKKGIEYGLECWDDVIGYAMDDLNIKEVEEVKQ